MPEYTTWLETTTQSFGHSGYGQFGKHAPHDPEPHALPSWLALQAHARRGVVAVLWEQGVAMSDAIARAGNGGGYCMQGGVLHRDAIQI
jgi:hypothetical protein